MKDKQGNYIPGTYDLLGQVTQTRDRALQLIKGFVDLSTVGRPNGSVDGGPRVYEAYLKFIPDFRLLLEDEKIPMKGGYPNYSEVLVERDRLKDAAQSVLTTLEAMKEDTMIGGMKMVLQQALNGDTKLTDSPPFEPYDANVSASCGTTPVTNNKEVTELYDDIDWLLLNIGTLRYPEQMEKRDIIREKLRKHENKIIEQQTGIPANRYDNG